ncbi:PQQ-binding-like beta-propeller repeat protein [Streptomyces sp. NPDC051243]|uniref:outer membrane protein assembly factor BamB family protein n=1 Tax=Streptomyces sp. NPDC051243 TaxID=3365646 RepID=UPI0037A7E9EC
MRRVWNVIKRFLAGIFVLLGVLALILVPTLTNLDAVPSLFRLLNQEASNVSASERAANGPLPGDLSLYAKEQSCSQGLKTPGYFPSLNGAEIADGARSGLFPCATFTGSTTAANQVFAYKSEDNYQGLSFINNKGPNATYVVGGNQPAPSGKVLPGPFVAKVDPTTGAQIWRTYLENANVDDVFVATTNLNVLADGSVVEAWDNQLVKLNPDTGAIVQQVQLPHGPAAPQNSSFKHVTVAPDGTLIIKDQVRPTGCKQQGSPSLAQCPGAGDPAHQANSQINAVDPNTFKILDSVTLPEESTTPHIITTHQGKTAIYLSANKYAYRYFWDPAAKKLSEDKSWVVDYLQKGQSTGDAPTLMGDWICIQTNGIGASVPSTITCVNANDRKNITRVTPFGPLKSGQNSFAPPKAGGDPENNMLYSADGGVGKVAGISIDPKTGKMTTKWTVADTSLDFLPLIGPKDNRILLTTKINPDATKEDMATGTYSQQVVWRDTRTGKALAESSFLTPFTAGALLTPGYGGRVYYPTLDGFYILQVIPKSKVPPTPESAG